MQGKLCQSLPHCTCNVSCHGDLGKHVKIWEGHIQLSVAIMSSSSYGEGTSYPFQLLPMWLTHVTWLCLIIPKVCRTQCSGPEQVAWASLGTGYLQPILKVKSHSSASCCGIFLSSSLCTSATDGSHTGSARRL